MLLLKVVFCVSLTWYAQKLSTESDVSKMHEAIKVDLYDLLRTLIKF